LGIVHKLFGALLLAATTSSGFYHALLQRGIEQVQRGDYPRAVQALHIAAFGFVDDVPNYQTAQIYLAVACEKLGRKDEAQAAVKKAIRAESVAQSYLALPLAPAVRAEFDKLAGPFARPVAPRIAATSKITASAPPPKAPVTPQVKPVPVPAPAPIPPPPAPAPQSAIAAAAKHQPSAAPILGTDITPQLSAAQGLLNEGRILAARQAYLRLAELPSLSRPQLLAVAKGLNETSAWRESSDLYARISPLAKGEELHMFAEAVNRYELGDRAAARVFLARAMPALPKTREILLYRGKIEGQP
jgi:tetratricopeptide (TPR) repeat protein